MSLSASGLLLLADLSTIARRTVITGTSTWFDAFVLAPGLHQQQRCDAFSSSISKRNGASASEPCTIKSTATGLETKVANEAVLGYLDRMAEGMNKAKTKGGEGISRGVTLHVGEQTPSNTPQTFAKSLGSLALRRLYNRLKERGIGNTVLAPLLYAVAPLLTALSMSLMLATRDWWGVGILCALMLARVLNIWVIRARTKKTQKLEVPDSHCGIVCSLKGHHVTKPAEMPAGTIQTTPGGFLPRPQTLEPTLVDDMAFDGRAAVDGPGGSFSAATGPNTQFPLKNTSQTHPPLEGTSMPTFSGPEKPLDIPIHKITEILPNLDRSTIPTQYLLNIPGASTPIKIQGRASDMESLLSGSWMREKTNVEGYMEAVAKVLVYGVAAVSGNMKQTGNIILGGLLVISAAALALANSEKAADTKEGFGGKVRRVDDGWDLHGDGVKDVDIYDEKDGLTATEKRVDGSAV